MPYYGLFLRNILYTDFPLDITPVVHYCLWILPLCTLLLCSMTHYDITMGNDVAMDIHCDVTMSSDVMHTSQCIIMLV